MDGGGGKKQKTKPEGLNEAQSEVSSMFPPGSESFSSLFSADFKIIMEIESKLMSTRTGLSHSREWYYPNKEDVLYILACINFMLSNDPSDVLKNWLEPKKARWEYWLMKDKS